MNGIKKTVLLIACFHSLSYGFADTVSEKEQERLQALENKLDRGHNAAWGERSPVYIGGDVLYWTARETGLAYAMQVDSPVVFIPNELDYKVLQPEYDWDFGFRISAGTNLGAKGWDLGATWTRFFTRARERNTPSAHSGYIPIWSSPLFTILTATASEAEASWKMLYNEVDVNLGRSYHVSKYFIVRPFFGPSGLWIDQHYDLEYEQVGQTFSKDVVKLQNAFAGVGLSGGCDLRFSFKSGWSIFGKATGGLYYGSFDIKRNEHLTSSVQSPEHFRTKHNLNIGAPTIAVAMGFSWDHLYSNDRCYVSVRLLWEHLLFFSQNQLFRFTTPNGNPAFSSFVSNQGDLTLQGGTFSATFGF